MAAAVQAAAKLSNQLAAARSEIEDLKANEEELENENEVKHGNVCCRGVTLIFIYDKTCSLQLLRERVEALQQQARCRGCAQMCHFDMPLLACYRAHC